ncbi:MAG TPA: DEAD/DEAH box helicase [Candidatus Nanoarchaeia archaeon]|nr:DEAD/DEAH box helicase [Candidatus Nanoarchaeia archaeon]
MEIGKLDLPGFFLERYTLFGNLTPIQEKSVNSGLFEGRSILACAPTASGKTLIASMAIANTLGKGKALYVVPLKALAKEKFNEYQSLLETTVYRPIISTGDIDSDSEYLSKYDLLILTSEKLDSLLRHKVSWLNEIRLVVVDEIHLLNDSSRGPTLEIILTLLKNLIKPQIIGLSATIGNPKELAEWLEAELIIDYWRPVELKQGIHTNGETKFY